MYKSPGDKSTALQHEAITILCMLLYATTVKKPYTCWFSAIKVVIGAWKLISPDTLENIIISVLNIPFLVGPGRY